MPTSPRSAEQPREPSSQEQLSPEPKRSEPRALLCAIEQTLEGTNPYHLHTHRGVTFSEGAPLVLSC